MAQIPEWATDNNYPAGSDPWSGKPTRVQPLSTTIAQGFVPGRVPPAEWFNWLFGTLFDESNDQDTRLAAIEAAKVTIQEAFDASVAAGNNPTLKLKSGTPGDKFTIED